MAKRMSATKKQLDATYTIEVTGWEADTLAFAMQRARILIGGVVSDPQARRDMRTDITQVRRKLIKAGFPAIK